MLVPSVNATPPTVIVGAGIIGLSTAYHLAHAISMDRPASSPQPAPIVVVDRAPAICSAASGQCEGAVGEFGFDNETQPLARLSYKLFTQLAADNDGGEAFGYSSFKVHTVFSNVYDPNNPRLPYPVEREEDITRLPSWLRVQPSWRAGLIDDGKTAARLDPPKFCSFLKQECEKLGVHFLLNSTATRAHKTRDEAGRLSLCAVDIRSGGSNAEKQHTIRVPCHALVISAGSWSPAAFSSLFPTARLQLRMAERQPVQTWLRFNAPNDKAEVKAKTETEADSCEQVWLNPLDDKFVQPTPGEIAGLSSLVTNYVDLSGGRKLVQSGRAYMPSTAHRRPVMARVPWGLLLGGEELTDEVDKGGVYLNFGHGLDGFTLGLGSGKVVSELILGEKTSVDLSPFGLPKAD